MTLPDPIVTGLALALVLHGPIQPGPAQALRDRLAGGCNQTGIVLANQGSHVAALAAFDLALLIHPAYVTALGNRANILHLAGRLDAALATNERALSIDPDHADSRYNRGLMLIDAERFDDALACFNQVLASHPDHTAALGNRGVVLHMMGRLQEAIASFARVQALQPGGDAAACMNESLARLAMGDFAGGWPRYEARWGTKIHPFERGFPQPQWKGEPLPPGRTILLHVDQGYGDTIQFCRYAPLLARRAHVVMELPAALMRLFATLSDELTLVTEGEALPPFDLHCPFGSLPLAFGTVTETIPCDIPYLRADSARVAGWRARVDALPGLKVGLVWAGDSGRAVSEAAARDRRRSVPLARLAPLGAIPGINFISLQKGEAAAQAAQPPPGMALHDWTAALADFADTAALIAALDLVITVDTSVAHLAGALGAPVWILNRFDACWRWLRDRTDSPWYPSARLFRQPALGAWDPLIEQAATALDQWRRTKVQ